MRRTVASLLVVAVVASMAIPAVAFAGGKGGNSKGNGEWGAVSADEDARAAQAAIARDARAQAKSARKDTGAQAKRSRAEAKARANDARRQEKLLSKAAREEARRAAKRAKAASSEVTSPTLDASPSVDATKTVGPGVSNALARITRNLERRIAKFGWGAKLPPGLVRVWLKFSGWLGNDTSATPWTPPVSADTSLTPSPSADQSGSVDPSATVVPIVP